MQLKQIFEKVKLAELFRCVKRWYIIDHGINNDVYMMDGNDDGSSSSLEKTQNMISSSICRSYPRYVIF